MQLKWFLTRAVMIVGTQIFAVPAFALPAFAPNMAPFVLGGYQLTTSQRGLGPICHSLRLSTSEPSCQPADLDELRERTFGATVYVADDYAVFYKNRDALTGQNKFKLIESLLESSEPYRFDAGSSFWYSSSQFSVALTTYRLSFLSSADTLAYPHVAIHASQEDQIQIQGGTKVAADAALGLRLRAMKRRQILDEFDLFDAVTSLDAYAKTQTSHLFLIEPGAQWQVEDRWKTTLSGLGTNIGFQTGETAGLPLSPVFDLGASVRPPIHELFGTLQLAANYRLESYWKESSAFRVGAVYSLGPLSTYAAYSAHDYTVGFNTGYSLVRIGIQYRNLELIKVSGGTTRDSSVGLEIYANL